MAAATLFSRVLGFLREILEASVLGGGAVASSWFLAFMTPNLFRRILGEGALGTALVPTISHIIELRGKEDAKRQLAAIFAWLGLVLVLICILVSVISLTLKFWVKDPSGVIALNLIPLLMPYSFFICLIGITGSILNTLRVFFLPALGSLLLNIFLIVCLLFICPGMTDIVRMLDFLAYAVLLSGVIQLAMLLGLMYWYDIFPSFSINNLKNFEILSELWKLTLPGLIGASVVQISFFIDRMMAYSIGPQAVPALNYSDRIVYLPIGVFAIAFGSVLLANMSKSAAKGDTAELVAALNLGLRHVLFVCVPIAAFTVFFRLPIVRCCFLRGKFTESDALETAWAMLFFGLGVPAFCAIKITLSAFYSRKDMKTPVKISFLCIFLNLILNVILMFPMQQGGLALATVISSTVNNCLLLYFLKKAIRHDLGLDQVGYSLLRSAVASFIPAGILFFCIYKKLHGIYTIKYLPADAAPLIICGVIFCISYALISWLCRSRELPELASMFRRG